MADEGKVERRKATVPRRKSESDRRSIGEDFAWVGTMLERRTKGGKRRQDGDRRDKSK